MKRGVLLHQDNSPANKSVVAMFIMHDYGIELIGHLPYSPNLASPGYFLFSNMKNIWLETGIRLIMTSLLL